jgi:maleate isomerase
MDLLTPQGDRAPEAMAATPSTRLGMLTPSSNTVLEPMTSAILAAVPNVSPHFSRLRVTEITVGPEALAQFDVTPMLDAASLLADARPQSIVWNGTSGGWAGLDADRRIAGALERRFSIPATTVTLSLTSLLRSLGMTSVGLVSPYTSDVQERIITTFATEGLACIASPHLGISENFAFSTVSIKELDHLVATAAAKRPDVIISFCTNLPATPHAARWEAEYGIPIFDSIAIAARAGLELSGLSPKLVSGWGKVFEL